MISLVRATMGITSLGSASPAERSPAETPGQKNEEGYLCNDLAGDGTSNSPEPENGLEPCSNAPSHALQQAQRHAGNVMWLLASTAEGGSPNVSASS
jgi:hypothetical protein